MRYPLTITNLHGRTAVVVGGGVVGERKVRSLVARRCAGASDQPDRHGAAHSLGRRLGEIVWQERPYRDGDLNGAGLVFAATRHPRGQP